MIDFGFSAAGINNKLEFQDERLFAESLATWRISRGRDNRLPQFNMKNVLRFYSRESP